MNIEDFKFPNDRKYWNNHTPSHLWLQQEDNETILIGVTDFFQKRLGKMVSITLKARNYGDICEAGKTMGLIKAKNYSAVLKYPLSGKINAINEKIGRKPDTVNKSPYQDGWLISVQPNPEFIVQLNNDNNIIDPDEDFASFIRQEIKNNALQADDCCPDFLGGSGVVRRRRK